MIFCNFDHICTIISRVYNTNCSKLTISSTVVLFPYTFTILSTLNLIYTVHNCIHVLNLLHTLKSFISSFYKCFSPAPLKHLITLSGLCWAIARHSLEIVKGVKQTVEKIWKDWKHYNVFVHIRAYNAKSISMQITGLFTQKGPIQRLGLSPQI